MSNIIDRRPHHKKRIACLKKELTGNTKRIRVKKKSISNLFRYSDRSKEAEARIVDLGAFNKPLYLDTKEQTLDVQGLTTYEDIATFTLKHGFLPTINPELKHITVGGATVGIGIESNCHRYGFVHDGVLEAEVLLPDGRIVVCSPDNEYADLFHGLPNSYGTLGYILRVKLKLYPAKPYVDLETHHFTTVEDFMAAMKEAAENDTADYIESMIYADDSLHLTLGTLSDTPHYTLETIYGTTPFYKKISTQGNISLPIKEYLFRYDPDWFWNVPETPLYTFFRMIAPPSIRNSAFYSRYASLLQRIGALLPFKQGEKDQEKLIQDWEVPWEHANALMHYALENVDVKGKPWLATAIKTPGTATCYPMRKNTLYFNLGFYGFARKTPGEEPFHSTRLMDAFTFSHSGIKMLYSTSFLDKSTFERVYGGALCTALKEKYDPQYLAPTVYDKTVQGV